MNFKAYILSTLLVACFLADSPTYAQSPGLSQKVTLSEKIKIPEITLKPGDYTFSVEDRLSDRTIVRITSLAKDEHFFVLTVPNAKLSQPASDGLIKFTTAKGKDEAVRGWVCSGCTASLEFVYPKAEAAKLTDETAESVLAFDPTYDHLPANLSQDDMKVITLWLLSPETITASNKGKGVKAEKWSIVAQSAASSTPVSSSSTSEVAQVPTPAGSSPALKDAESASTTAASTNPASATNGTSEVAQPAPAPPSSDSASNVTRAGTIPSGAVTAEASTAPPAEMAQLARSGGHSERMPKTAGSSYLYLLSGMLLIISALGVRLLRGVAFPRK